MTHRPKCPMRGPGKGLGRTACISSACVSSAHRDTCRPAPSSLVAGGPYSVRTEETAGGKLCWGVPQGRPAGTCRTAAMLWGPGAVAEGIGPHTLSAAALGPVASCGCHMGATLRQDSRGLTASLGPTHTALWDAVCGWLSRASPCSLEVRAGVRFLMAATRVFQPFLQIDLYVHHMCVSHRQDGRDRGHTRGLQSGQAPRGCREAG